MSDKITAKKAVKPPQKPEKNPKATQLAEFITKQLGDRVKRLDKQSAAIANGGLSNIIKSVTEGISNETPNVKLVALIQVLNKCGSKATEKDLAAK